MYSPDDGRSIPPIIFNNVLFPEPLVPMTAIKSSSLILKLKLLSASVCISLLPYFFDIFFSSIMLYSSFHEFIWWILL